MDWGSDSTCGTLCTSKDEDVWTEITRLLWDSILFITAHTSFSKTELITKLISSSDLGNSWLETKSSCQLWNSCSSLFTCTLDITPRHCVLAAISRDPALMLLIPTAGIDCRWTKLIVQKEARDAHILATSNISSIFAVLLELKPGLPYHCGFTLWSLKILLFYTVTAGWNKVRMHGNSDQRSCGLVGHIAWLRRHFEIIVLLRSQPAWNHGAQDSWLVRLSLLTHKLI